MSVEKDPVNLYTELAIDPGKAGAKWGLLYEDLQLDKYIPHSAFNCMENAHKLIRKDDTPEMVEIRNQIAVIFETTTRDLGVWTRRARLNLERYRQTGACVEVGHQPKFLAGERFLLNKIACGGILSRNAWIKETSTVSSYIPGSFLPFLFIGDHDKVHRELTRTVIPSINGASGKTLHLPKILEKRFNGSMVDQLPLPSLEEYQQILEDFRKTMQFSFTNAAQNPYQRQLWEERMEHGLTLLKTAYHGTISSNSNIPPYSQWFGRTIGILANIIGDYGYVFINATHPKLQELFVPHYEFLLRQRENYIQIYREISEHLTQYGFKSALRDIDRDFVPFFANCSNPECHHERISLSASVSSIDSDKIILHGKCGRCNHEVQIETSKNKPDLWDWRNLISPRVDSRQYLVSSTIKPQIHVAGTGETRYYMHDLPLLSRIDPKVVLPQIYFYNKITFNTPWTRALEPQLMTVPDFLPTLKAMMKVSGKIQKIMKKKDEPSNLNQYRKEMLGWNLPMQQAYRKLEEICRKSLNEENLPLEIRQNILPVFLANFFGRIRKEKHGQTSVFHWSDLLINKGMGALFQDYERVYKSWQIPGIELIL